MIGLFLAAILATQAPAGPSPGADDAQGQAQGRAALEGMTKIFTTLGSCERHFTPAQVQGVKRGFQPAAGKAPTPLQAYIAAAYERGKADASLSAPACQEIMRVLAEQKKR